MSSPFTVIFESDSSLLSTLTSNVDFFIRVHAKPPIIKGFLYSFLSASSILCNFTYGYSFELIPIHGDPNHFTLHGARQISLFVFISSSKIPFVGITSESTNHMASYFFLHS